MQIKSLAQKLYPLIGPVIFCLALWSISVELRGYDYGDIWRGIERIEGGRILRSLLCTGGSYLAVSCYDVISFQYLRHTHQALKAQLETAQIALAGFITYAISPTIGLPFVTGGALRYRLYSPWGVSPLQIAQVILFSNFSLWVGLCAVAGGVLLIRPSPIPTSLDLPFPSLQPLGAICVVLAILYLCVCGLIKAPIRFRSRYLQLPSLGIAVAQVVTFGVDWGFACGALYSLLDLPAGMGFLDFFGIYVIAMVAGLISTVPGGLGVFETVLIFFLDSMINNAVILGTILIFRLIYYILPLGLAILTLGGFEIRQRRLSRDATADGSTDDSSIDKSRDSES